MTIDLEPVREALDNVLKYTPCSKLEEWGVYRAITHLQAIENQPTDRVSLEKCAVALGSYEYEYGHVRGDFDDFETCLQHQGNDFRKRAKAVLDATGVPYGD